MLKPLDDNLPTVIIIDANTLIGNVTEASIEAKIVTETKILAAAFSSVVSYIATVLFNFLETITVPGRILIMARSWGNRPFYVLIRSFNGCFQTNIHFNIRIRYFFYSISHALTCNII